ncbi:MAG: lysophospholipase [Anaerolineaceae bacterium]|nr:lysophospholipase [Anaerolineaceae bacterium]
MQHSTGSFTNKDGLKIYTESWLPDREPTAVVMIVHGHAEHIGRYSHVAAALVKQGWAVYGLDHKGHGQSEGERAHYASVDEPVADLRQYFEQVQARHAGLPIAMLGHSMGSIISLMFTLKYQKDLAALVITGTATKGEDAYPKALIPVVRLLGTLAPRLRLNLGGDSSVLTTDPAVNQAFDDDPLVMHKPMSAGLGWVLIKAGREINQRAHELKLPLLIGHGEEDKLTPISGSYTVHKQAGSPDKKLITYPGMRHEVMNEPIRDQVLADIIGWLNDRLP